jgi:hypothetical protein
MTVRRSVLCALAVAACAATTAPSAMAARTYPDRAGDVRGGQGPDVTSVTVSNTSRAITFVVRFAKAPPLVLDEREGWVDMLLMGFDVPPLGPAPIPDGEWFGANFAAGTHGPAKTGLVVRLPRAAGERSRVVARFAIVTRRATVRFTIPRHALGNPPWFAFTVAAAREGESEREGGADYAPARGTFRYALAG